MRRARRQRPGGTPVAFLKARSPLLKAFEALDPSARQALRADIAQLLLRRNQGGDASLLIPGQYLEVVLLRS